MKTEPQSIARRCLSALPIVLALLLVTVGPFAAPEPAAAQSPSAEQQLAEKYAPIFFIKEHLNECALDGEPYLPASLESVLGNPAVALRRIAQDGESSDPIIMMAPEAQDLAGLDETYYLDFPGEPRNPGCDYEEWFNQVDAKRGYAPIVYAHIATDESAPGKLAVQFWHYWVFNDFNNKHESDWEMVQLTFPVGTAEEALSVEPESVAFAQHGGGERSDWDDEKLLREGDRIFVYPASGSHASYYNASLWIGWGANGSGFGCDDIQDPVVQIDPQVVLIPDEIDPDGEFAWLLFDGRWGQRESWEFNGPKGPASGAKWSTPISWTDDIRENSLPVPGHPSVGPGPAALFCTISSAASMVVTIFPVSPWVPSIFVAVVMLMLITIVVSSWHYIWNGAKLYVRHLPVFGILSLLIWPVAWIGAEIDKLVSGASTGGSEGEFEDFLQTFGTSIGIGFNGFQQLLAYSLIAPLIIYATYDVMQGHDKYGVVETWSVVLRRFPTLIRAVLVPLLFTSLLAATVILAPIALYKAVQWMYTPHAAIIEGASWRQARHVSKRVVKGHWWRVLGLGTAVAFFSGVPGPLIGVIALVLGTATMNTANIIATLVYLVAYPAAVIAATLYFIKRIKTAESKTA